MRQRNNMNLRHEYKYLLHPSMYLQLRDTFKKVMKIDNNTKNEDGYHIRSLYFDDMYDTAMKEKALGLVNRKKYRIRIYDYSDKVIKLEEKIKYSNYNLKNSCNITFDEYKQILDGDIVFLLDNNSLKGRYYLEIRNKLLKPKVIVDYLREAYILPYNQIRITFDKNLSAAKPHSNIFDRDICSNKLGQDYSVILEVKYNNFLPRYIRNILETYSMNRLSVSKYSLCREYIDRH